MIEYNTKHPIIIKADGSNEIFDPQRLTLSLERSGASVSSAEQIAKKITETVIPNTSSHDIYAHAFELLREDERPIAARYAIRRALMELGPTGHPFEDFISHLYRTEGWEVETRKIIKGKCVSHEVDFYASHTIKDVRSKDENASRTINGVREFLAAELKYHNDPRYKTDLKVALYVKSRFDDIFSCDESERSCPLNRGILITNTKFTSEAIAYAECSGVELLGWGYPVHDTLFMRMCRAKVYPITALTKLSHAEKHILIENGIIAVDQMVRDPRALEVLHVQNERVHDLLVEADALLSVA